MKSRSAASCPALRAGGALALFTTAATLLAASATALAQPTGNGLPIGFVHLTDIAQTVELDIRYEGTHNFMGRPALGYLAPTCILTRPTAQRLLEVQRALRPMRLTLKVFDCYRPQQAVNDFVAWSKDSDDQKGKVEFYPDVPKETLFERGYIAEKSGHSRGSTVDLTLAALPDSAPSDAIRGDLLANGEADMGTPFDFFDVKSNTDNPDLSDDIRHNRAFFKELMEHHGFHNLPEEWWHYTLVDEPYPASYFNFPVR